MAIWEVAEHYWKRGSFLLSTTMRHDTWREMAVLKPH